MQAHLTMLKSKAVPVLSRVCCRWHAGPTSLASGPAVGDNLVPASRFLLTFVRRVSWRLLSPDAVKLTEKASPMHQYEMMVSQNLIQFDPVQHEVAKSLDELLLEMKEHQRKMRAYHKILNQWQAERSSRRKDLLKQEAETAARQRLELLTGNGQGFLKRWLTRKRRRKHAEPGAGRLVAHLKREKVLDELVGPLPEPPLPPQGIYLYGSVGCGKTMLMDMLFTSAEGVVQQRRRLHFHAAMLEVHALMHSLEKQHLQSKAMEDASTPVTSESPPSLSLERAMEEWLEEERKFQQVHKSDVRILDEVADRLLGSRASDGASLLCFDEVQVVDVFTAVALSGILGRLLRRGGILVATSNRAPSDLNKEGLQKEIFASFIAELQQHCRPFLVGLDKDYRRFIASKPNELVEQWHYLWPLNQQSEAIFNCKWKEIIGPLVKSGQAVIPRVIPVMFGRELEVPESCAGVARFSFDELCERPVGAADYIALARHYHTVFIKDIPIMSMRIRDKARRFITLVDELYNHRCRLVCTAEAPVDELFVGHGEEPLIDLESLQFETEAEGIRLRSHVLKSGDVSPIALTSQDRASIRFLLSGREELFAFHRAVSRLIEMQTMTYQRMHQCHPALVEGNAL